MHLLIDELGPHGRDVRVGLADAWAVEAVALAVEGSVSALEATVHVERAGRGADVIVAGEAVASRACDRCGQALSLRLTISESLRFERTPSSASASQVPSKGEVELDAEDLDVGWLDADGGLAVEDVLAEAFALALPMRVTCSEVAPGPMSGSVVAGEGSAATLVAADGVDVSACDAIAARITARQDPVGHPAFQVLKNLR